MNGWKKILAGAAALSLCAVMMMGCTAEKKTGGGAAARPDGMQAGARVENYVTPEGDKAYSYTNPDGSSGGGVEIS